MSQWKAAKGGHGLTVHNTVTARKPGSEQAKGQEGGAVGHGNTSGGWTHWADPQSLWITEKSI